MLAQCRTPHVDSLLESLPYAPSDSMASLGGGAAVCGGGAALGLTTTAAGRAANRAWSGGGSALPAMPCRSVGGAVVAVTGNSDA